MLPPLSRARRSFDPASARALGSSSSAPSRRFAPPCRREGAEEEDPRARADAGSKDLRARDRGGSIAGLGVRTRVARSRQLVAKGYALAAVARVLGVTRQAIYRTPKPRTAPQRRPVSSPVDLAIVDVAKENPTDGYRRRCTRCADGNGEHRNGVGSRGMLKSKAMVVPRVLPHARRRAAG